MKIGITPVNVGGPEVKSAAKLAVKAESVGVESVWTFEHVIVPCDYQSKYPYNDSGKMGAMPETHFIDPLIQLANVAGQTSKLRLGTGVNILPQANPLFLAKQAASLDFISGGRFLLGVGIGWLEEEYAALGVPFARRGARFDDYVVAMKKVWSGEVVEHRSDFIQWSGFKSYPLPVQKPHLPLIIGGASRKAFERVIDHGDGWFAPQRDAAKLAEQIEDLFSAAEKKGRDPKSIEITTMWPYPFHGDDSVEKYADMGVSRLIIPLMSMAGAGNVFDMLDKLGDEVIAKLPD